MAAPERVFVTGNTYPVKDALKTLGARWDPDQRAWSVPKEQAEAAQKLVDAGTPAGSGMRGQLWQECAVKGCNTEPVCVRCENCQRHCGC